MKTKTYPIHQLGLGLRNLAIGALWLSLSLTVRATALSWNEGDTGGTWSTAGNWSPAAVPGSTDTATLTDVSSGTTRTVVYDTGASGSLLGLTMTELSGGTNILDLQKNLAITNAVSLGGGSTNGTDEVILEPGISLTVGSTANGGLTIGAGGLLEANVSSAANTDTYGSTSGLLTLSGGEIEMTNPASGGATGAFQFTIGTAFTISSGTIDVNATAGSARLQANGNFTATGGSLEGPLSQFNLVGATNSISNFNTGATVFSLNNTTTSQSLTTNQSVGGLQLLAGGGAGAVITKTLTMTGSGTTIGNITFGDSTSTGTLKLLLGSNVTLATGAALPTAPASGQPTSAGTVNFTIDTAGHVLDLTANTGVWTPNAAKNGTFTSTTTWTLNSSGGTPGSIRATGFNLATASTVTTVGPNMTLESTGGNSTANNLGTSGTIDPTSTFLYSGNAAAATAATLVSGRTIGNLAVQNGALNVNQASLTAGGGVAVSTGGNLILNGGTTAATLTLGSGQNFTVNSGALTFALGSATGLANGSTEIFGNNGTGSGGTFTLTGLTLDITQGTGFSTSNTYQLLANFSSSTAVSNIATNIAGFDANIDSTGLLSFSPAAVPEPSTWGLMFIGLGLLALRSRRQVGWSKFC